MKRTLRKIAACTSLMILALPSASFAGRGGGRGGGGMQRGGGGGGMQRGGGGEGMQRGGGGGGMNHSPSFSQPHGQGNESGDGGRNSNANGGGRGSSSNNPNAGAAAGGAAYANKNQSGSHSNAGAAAAGADASNKNQSGNHSNAGAAAAGADAANKNQKPYPNAGAAAGGAAYADRNQKPYPNAGAAAGGAAYSNRNQSSYPNAGAAAGGAAYANRNQNPYPNAAPAAAGAAYANRNQYDQYHPGMSAGSWNGNYGASAVGGYGGVGAWGAGSPAYGYGVSSYSNPYAGGVAGGGTAQPGNAAPPAGAQPYDYSQPLNTAAAPPEPAAVDQGSSAVAEARQSFQSGDYENALQLVRQALVQMPNDATLHEYLGLVLFAKGDYEQAAAPLYAVLSVGPGWDWTTLISNYPEAGVYDRQLQGLVEFARANPKSAQARFVLAYHYLCQGHGDAAIKLLERVVVLQPTDTLSAQLLAKLRPAGTPAVATASPSQAEPFDAGKLTGTWVAQPSKAKITLTINDDASYDWGVAAVGKPPLTITGKATVDGGVLTLSSSQAGVGEMAGEVTWKDDKHFDFRAVGAPSNDPGLKFAR